MPDRIAIVTGGLTGIGLASARALAAAGCKVAVGSRRGREDALVAAAAFGPEVHVGALDVRDRISVDAFIAAVRDRFGQPLILVNAAGIFREVPLPGHADADWEDQIDINLSGPFRMTRALFGPMCDAGWGRIVNIASTNATTGAAGYAGYCASKAGLVGLTKATAVEGAPFGVTCVSISPTWVETPMMDNALTGAADIVAAKQAMKSANPQGRLVQPDEVGALVAFCCSEAAPALTNEDIQVNAGAES